MVQTRALDGLSVGVDHGEFVAVTGPSGSGTYKLEGEVSPI